MNGKSLLYGIVTGAVIGSITTLLSTPKTGKDIQKLLKNNYVEINDFMQKKKKETIAVKDQVKETVKISTDTIKNVSTDLKNSVDEWRDEVEPAITQLKNEIDELQKTLQNRS